MAINKFVDRQGNTLLDLSTDSVSPNKVLAGTTFHGPDGLKYRGTLDPGPLDYSQYNFIDYDGTILYSFTDEEIDALIKLPAGPDHTDDNLTFQEWNWLLGPLKAWDRRRPDRPIVGANYITTDGKSYLYLDTPLSGATLTFSKSGTLNSVDWGDGTIDTNTSHVYPNPGQYVIVIDMAEGGYWYISNGSPSTSTNAQYIRKIKMGNVSQLYSNGNFYGCRSLETITIPKNVIFKYQTCYECNSLKAIVVPYGIQTMAGYMFGNCYSLNAVSLPHSITSVQGDNHFSNCTSLRNITLPDNLGNIGFGMFGSSAIETIAIPYGTVSIDNSVFQNCTNLTNIICNDNVQVIGSNCFPYQRPITLDISKPTEVITLGGSLGFDKSTSTILVPASLLSDYKSASKWSAYAEIMVGI